MSGHWERPVNSEIPESDQETVGRNSPSPSSLGLPAAVSSPAEECRSERDSSTPTLSPSLSIPNLLVTSPSFTSVSYVCEADHARDDRGNKIDSRTRSPSPVRKNRRWREFEETRENTYSSLLTARVAGHDDRPEKGTSLCRSGEMYEAFEETASSVEKRLAQSAERFVEAKKRSDGGNHESARVAAAAPRNAQKAGVPASLDAAGAAEPCTAGPSYAFSLSEKVTAGSGGSPESHSPPSAGHFSDTARVRKASEKTLDSRGPSKRSRSPSVAGDFTRPVNARDSVETSRGFFPSDASPRRNCPERWENQREEHAPGSGFPLVKEGRETPIDTRHSASPSKKRCCLAQRFAFERRRQPPLRLPSVASAVAAALAQFPPGVSTPPLERGTVAEGSGATVPVAAGTVETSLPSLPVAQRGASSRNATLDSSCPAKGAAATLGEEALSSEVGEGVPEAAAVAAALSGWSRGRGPRSVCMSGSSRASSLEQADCMRRCVERKRAESRRAALAAAAVASASVRRLALVAAPQLVENTLRQWWCAQETEEEAAGALLVAHGAETGGRAAGDALPCRHPRQGAQGRPKTEVSGGTAGGTIKMEDGEASTMCSHKAREASARDESKAKTMEALLTKQEGSPAQSNDASASNASSKSRSETQDQRDSCLRVTLFAARQVLNSGQFRQAIRLFPGADSPRGDLRSHRVFRAYRQSVRRRRTSRDPGRRASAGTEDGCVASVSLRELLETDDDRESEVSTSSPSAAELPCHSGPLALSSRHVRSFFGSFSRRGAEGLPGAPAWGGDRSPAGSGGPHSPRPLSGSHELRRRRVCPPRRRYSPSESVHRGEGRGEACAIATSKKPKTGGAQKRRGRDEEQTREGEASQVESRCSTPRSCSSVRYAVSDCSPPSAGYRSRLGTRDEDDGEAMPGGRRTPRACLREGPEDSDVPPPGADESLSDRLGDGRFREGNDRWAAMSSVAVVPFAPNILAKKDASDDGEGQRDITKVSLDWGSQQGLGDSKHDDTGEHEATVPVPGKSRPRDSEGQTRPTGGANEKQCATLPPPMRAGLLEGLNSAADGRKRKGNAAEMSPFSEATGICILRRSQPTSHGGPGSGSCASRGSTQEGETSDKRREDAGTPTGAARGLGPVPDAQRDSLGKNGEIVAIWARARDARHGGRIRRRIWLPPAGTEPATFSSAISPSCLSRGSGGTWQGVALPLRIERDQDANQPSTESGGREERRGAAKAPFGSAAGDSKTEEEIMQEMKAWWAELTCNSADAAPVQTWTLDDFARSFSTLATRAIQLLCLAFRARGARPVPRPSLLTKTVGDSSPREHAELETRTETLRQQVRGLLCRYQQIHQEASLRGSPASNSRVVGEEIQRLLGQLHQLREAQRSLGSLKAGARRRDEEETVDEGPASLFDFPCSRPRTQRGRRQASRWYSVGVRWLADCSAFEYFVVRNRRKDDGGASATASLCDRGQASDTVCSPADGPGTPRTSSPSPPNAVAAFSNLWAQAYAPGPNQPRGLSPATTPPLSESATPRGNVSPPFSEASFHAQRAGKNIAPRVDSGAVVCEKKDDEDREDGGASPRRGEEGERRRLIPARSRLLLHELLQPLSLDATGLRAALVLILLRLQRFLRLKQASNKRRRGRPRKGERNRQSRAACPIFVSRDDSDAFQEALLARNLDIPLGSFPSPESEARDLAESDTNSALRLAHEGAMSDQASERLSSVGTANPTAPSVATGVRLPSTAFPHCALALASPEGKGGVQEDGGSSVRGPLGDKLPAGIPEHALLGRSVGEASPRSLSSPAVHLHEGDRRCVGARGTEETPPSAVDESLLDSEGGDRKGAGPVARRGWRGRASRGASPQHAASPCPQGDKARGASGSDPAAVHGDAASAQPSTCSSPQPSPSPGGRRERGRRSGRARGGSRAGSGRKEDRGRLNPQPLASQTACTGASSGADTAGAASTEGDEQKTSAHRGGLEHSDEDKEDLAASSQPSDDATSQRSSGSHGDSASSGARASESVQAAGRLSDANKGAAYLVPAVDSPPSPNDVHASARPPPPQASSWTTEDGDPSARAGSRRSTALTLPLLPVGHGSAARAVFSEDTLTSRVSRPSSLGALLGTGAEAEEDPQEERNAVSTWLIEKGVLEPFWWRAAAEMRRCASFSRRGKCEEGADQDVSAEGRGGGGLEDLVLSFPRLTREARVGGEQSDGEECEKASRSGASPRPGNPWCRDPRRSERQECREGREPASGVSVDDGDNGDEAGDGGGDSDGSCDSAVVSTTSESSGISDVSLDPDCIVQHVAFDTVLSTALSALYRKTADGQEESDAEREASADVENGRVAKNESTEDTQAAAHCQPPGQDDEEKAAELEQSASSVTAVKNEQTGETACGEAAKQGKGRARRDADDRGSRPVLPVGEGEGHASGSSEQAPPPLLPVASGDEDRLFTEVPQNEEDLKRALQHVDPRLCQQMLHDGLGFIRTYVTLDKKKKEILQGAPFAARGGRVAQLLRGLQGLFDALECVREREGDEALPGEQEGEDAPGGSAAKQETEEQGIVGDRESERGSDQNRDEVGEPKASVEDAVAIAFCRAVGTAVREATASSRRSFHPGKSETDVLEPAGDELRATPLASSDDDDSETRRALQTALHEERDEGIEPAIPARLGMTAAEARGMQGDRKGHEGGQRWTEAMGHSASLFLAGTLELEEMKHERHAQELHGEGDSLTCLLLASDRLESTNESWKGGDAGDLGAGPDEGRGEIKRGVREGGARTACRPRAPSLEKLANAGCAQRDRKGGATRKRQKRDEKHAQQRGNLFLEALLQPVWREETPQAFLIDFGSQAPEDSAEAGKPIFMSPCVFGVRGASRWKKLCRSGDEVHREDDGSPPWRHDQSETFAYRADAPQGWKRQEGLRWGGSRYGFSGMRHHGRKSPAFLSPQWDDDERFSLSSSADERGYTSSGSEMFLSVPPPRKYGLRFQGRSRKTARATRPSDGRSSENRTSCRESLRPSSGLSGEETPSRSLSSGRRRGGLGGSSPAAFHAPMTRAAAGRAGSSVRQGDGEDSPEADAQFGTFGTPGRGLPEGRGAATEGDTRDDKPASSPRHGKRGGALRSGGAREAGIDAGTDTLWVQPGSSPTSHRSGRRSPAAAAVSSLPTGVYFDASRKLWRCQWRENGRFKTKGFSLNVYKTLKEARRACVVYRCLMGGWEVDPRWLGPDDDEQDNSGGADEVAGAVPSDGVPDAPGGGGRKEY
ncbi:unnamed protein product [Neospora caninum Liverpool]|nr:uncharacterized protein NCLIV_058430 [Neospora caninum Liverpool]CBZ55420.1 unnamed protein product [Neospora caninum Liverpool]|eukprot:XP_003885448.1 uncharacterized protein NCLIV_058430 [Neospora caninum Liverpool]